MALAMPGGAPTRVMAAALRFQAKRSKAFERPAPPAKRYCSALSSHTLASTAARFGIKAAWMPRP